MSERYLVSIRGTRPLLMHRLPADVGESRQRVGVRPDPRAEAERALYRDGHGNIVVPALNVLSCLRVAARDLRVPGKGRKTFRDYIFSGLVIEPENIPLVLPDGRNPEEAWQLDLRPVMVQKARVIRARPRFDQWALRFTVEIVDPIITEGALRRILEDAGRYVGLLDGRPLFGLFAVERFEKA
jgi:hypothetical protein